MLKEIKKYVMLLIVVLAVVTCNGKVYAVDGENDGYSELYQRYLNMSEEEKKNQAVIPRKYDVPMSVLYSESEFKNKGLLSNVWKVIQQSKAQALPKSYILLKDENTDIECDAYGGIDIKVENQGSYGLCWDFTCLTALETNLALQGKAYDLSEMHMGYLVTTDFGGSRTLTSGGNFDDFEEYTSYNYGPVLEEEVPYREYSKEEYEYLMSLNPAVCVNETIDFPTINKVTNNFSEEELLLFRQKVKEHIMSNGGIYASICASEEKEYNGLLTKDSTVKWYNGKWVLNYSESAWSNHAVTIIGWDDDFSANNFPEDCRPQNNGAYIALNSWGSDWGENGVFYISYEDLCVEFNMSGIVSATLESNKGETIKFQDENLYQAMKKVLHKSIIGYDDGNKEIYLSKIAINRVSNLNLSNKNISDITGLEKFTNLFTLDLSNNNISDISILGECVNLCSLNLSSNNITNIYKLEKLNRLYELDLSNNNVRDLSNLSEGYYAKLNVSGNVIEKLPNNAIAVSELYLDNCKLDNNDLKEIYEKFTDIGLLSLKNNNITDFSCLVYEYNEYNGGMTLDISGNNVELDKLPDMNNLILKNSNITDISTIRSDIKVDMLDLSNNPIENVNILKNLNLIDLNISYTNVKDVSMLTNIVNLDISGNNDVEGINLLIQLESLKMDNCNLEDSKINDIVKDLKKLTYLSINDNKITNLEFLNNNINLFVLYANDNFIADISGIKNAKSISSLYLRDNNIKNIIDLENCTNLFLLDLSNNDISTVEGLEKCTNIYELNLSNTRVENVDNLNVYNLIIKNQQFSFDINIEKGKENVIDAPNMLNEAFKNGMYKENVIFNCENCTINSIASKVNLKSDTLGKGQARVTVDGGDFDGTMYTINYNTVEKINVTDMKVKKESDINYYVENENFESDGLIIEVTYENGLKEETNEYTLINAENLKVGQENIIIRSSKNPEIEIIYPINVYGKEKVKELKFEDESLYSEMQKEYTYDKYMEPVKILKTNDKQHTIMMLIDDIERVKDLFIDGTNVKNIAGLENFINLERLYIGDTQLNDIQKLLEMERLEEISIIKTDINLISDSMTEVILPQYIYQSLTMQENVSAEAYIYYSSKLDEKFFDDSDESKLVEVHIDDERKVATVKLDDSVSTEGLKIKGIQVEIKGGKTNGALYLAFRNNLGINIIDYDQEQDGDINYITNINPNTTIEQALEKIQVNEDVTKEVYSEETKIEDKNKNLGTGMKIKIQLNDEVVEYTAIVIGDCNGSGTTNVADLTKLMQSRAESLGDNIDETKVLKGAFEKAVDLNKDGKINAVDITKLSMFIAENK